MISSYYMFCIYSVTMSHGPYLDRKNIGSVSDNQQKSAYMKWKKAILINLAVILAIVAGLAVFFTTPFGQPALKTILLVPEVVPSFPVKPLGWVSKAPAVSEVNLQVGDKEIKADLYRPKDNKEHPAVIFTLGTIVTRKDPAVTKFAQALARTGFVVLLPDLPDFLSGFIWTDSVETLISSVQYLENQEYVVQDRIGLIGFCVGGSVSILAAEDKTISDKVNFIIAVSPYFDTYTSLKAIFTEQIGEPGNLRSWQSALVTKETLARGFIELVNDQNDREVFRQWFLRRKLFDTPKLELKEDSRKIFDFITNSDYVRYDQFWENLPQETKAVLLELSPKEKIGNLRANVFILNDKKDTLVPSAEGKQLTESLTRDKVNYLEIDSFEHVRPGTKLPRWAATKQIYRIFGFIYVFFSKVS